MASHPVFRLLRGIAIAASALAVAPLSFAVRLEAGAPAASAVLATPQQAAAAQADESASLRVGVITALDARGTRLQVQGIWLDVVADKTLVLRNGEPAKLETLKVGDIIKFTVAPGAAEGQAVRVIYAP
jgi:nitrous oxidase accessory protein NosD